MRVSPASYERSIVRSRLRNRALLTLASLGEAFPRQLANAIGIDAWRLQALMYGRLPDYSPEYALVPLGLAESRMTLHGRVYGITGPGLRKARQLQARRLRRSFAREANREWGRRAWPRVDSAAASSVGTPEVRSTASFAWSVAPDRAAQPA